MKITFVCATADFGGGFRVIATYAKLLQERGHEVFLVYPPRRAPELKDHLRSLRRHGRLAARIPQRSHLDDAGLPFHMLESHRAVTERDLPDADIVIATWWQTVEWIRDLPASKGLKVHLVQDYEIWGGDAADVDAALRAPIPKVTISGWLMAMLRERFGASDVTLIPNAVDLDLFSAPARGKQPVPTFGFVHSNEGRKGSDIVVDAARMIRAELPSLKGLAFATVPATNVPVPDYVALEVRPSQPRIREIYASCDVWLFGSRVEGFGLPLLEALSCRCPVVATPAGAAPDLLANGGGLVMSGWEPAEMAASALKILSSDDATWRRMSDDAFHAASRRTWDAAGEELELTFQRLVAARV